MKAAGNLGNHTPFLDELSEKGLLFKNAYANSRRSIEGIASILAGIPSLMTESFINSQYVSNFFWGIGSLLSERNYSSAFFHGAKNGSMYFDQFTQKAGIQSYFGLNEYPHKSDYDGSWGIWDEPFLQWTAQKINAMPQPFLASIFTLTSHHPFKIPQQYQGAFPKGNLDILESIAYTDLALKKFFDEIRKQPWFANTLFVISADHTYKNSLPEFDHVLGKFRIPILFFHPQISFKAVDPHQQISQIDILPSILDFLGFKMKEQNYLGRSVFVLGDRSVTLYDEGAFYTLAENQILRWVKGKEPQVFNVSDVDFKNPLKTENGLPPRLLQTQRATLQYFSEGMWDNRLYYPQQ
jgi:phosphoglycerol transferase MdoB-like AlkP superfamily enzyme